MNRVHVSVSKGYSILKRTMMSLGYDKDTADLGVWSALWLEKRKLHGVTDLIVYMCLIADLDFVDLKPRKHPEYKITGICPFMLASFMAEREEILMSRGAVALGAPASTKLFAPLITDLVSLCGKSLRIKHHDNSCLYSGDGVEFESKTFGTWGMIATDNNGPMLLELTDDKPDMFGVDELDGIDLPKVRLRDDGLLRLG